MRYAHLPLPINFQKAHFHLPILIPCRASCVGGVIQCEMLTILNMQGLRRTARIIFF